MARDITNSMAGVLERLELERPQLVTVRELERMLAEEGVATPAPLAASRLRERGWLLPTGVRGVWEFAPADVAGPYPSGDPLLAAKALAASRPDAGFAVCGQAAAWALGLADRAPSAVGLAFARGPVRLRLPEGVRGHVFAPNLPAARARGAAVLSPESLVVDMAAGPASVASWQSAAEWLPDVAVELDAGRVLAELAGRPSSVAQRSGYLLQGMRPDVAGAIEGRWRPRSKVRFGPREPALRNDERWKVADTLLPFDPRDMGEGPWT